MFDTLTVWLVAIIILLYAYVYVWSRGPQDGKLWRMIRRLRKSGRYWRKRALRDEAILSRVIDKKSLALVAVLCLFLIPVVNPDMSSMPAHRVNDLLMVQETPFLTAADGNESSESITSFSETLDDDAMYYPDGYNGSITRGDYRNNMDTLSGWWYLTGVTSITESSEMVTANGTASGGSGSKECFGVNEPDYSTVHDDYHIVFQIRCNVTSGLSFRIMIATGDNGLPAANGYRDFTLASADTWYTQVLNVSDGANPVGSYQWCIWTTNGAQDFSIDVRLLVEVERWNSYSGYFYDFADVSDWSTWVDASMSTDGDVGCFDVLGDSAWDRVYTDGPSITQAQYYYIEARYKANVSSVTLNIWLYPEDTHAGSGVLGLGLTAGTSWLTSKAIISTSMALESIAFLTQHGSNVCVSLDYLRIGPADEMGWQHDGSTTAGVSVTGSDSSPTLSSDDDLLHFTSDDSNYAYMTVTTDTTATSASISLTDYPFFAFRWNASTTQQMYIQFKDESTWSSLYSLTETNDFVVTRYNLDAILAGDYLTTVMIMDGKDGSQDFYVDWLKAYSIANFTYTSSGCGTDDSLYVDSGVLYASGTFTYQQLYYQPALSVATDTYNVWNITRDDSDLRITYYAGGWTDWYTGARGDFGAQAGNTLTVFQFRMYEAGSISAIKFIEDGTAPSVLRISATPPEPDDTESVTLSALATDTVEVYKVWFRPITGPTGYSPTDYEATEQADNLWTYEFSSLDEGYWAFKAIAFDGANNSTLDADSVTDFWVREKELIISNTLYTETSTQCSFAGQTNVACDYIIYDDDAEQESGNKAAGSFFLDWTKQTSVGTHDWGIKFYTASSTDWHNGSYEVLTTTLLVTEYGIRTTTSYAYLNGYVTLDSTYKVYEETVEVGAGSVNAGSFEIRWTKASSSVENVTVLFESGAQSYNVYSGYDVAEQATFVVESWWMDLNLGVESYVEFYVLSSFENATVYVYDNNTLMTTVTESAGGAYSYFWMAESQGLHIITLNITHGATVHTRTRTYFIPDWAVTGLVLRWDLWTFQDNYTMMELESNWNNCTYYVYLNGSLVATSANDPVILNFTRSINIGEYNLTVYADAGTQTYTIKNIRYIITEEGVSYDYSQVTGGRSVRYGDNYYEYHTVTGEPTPGILIDQGTAAITSVGGFLIIFVAYLAAREMHKREILKTERIFGK